MCINPVRLPNGKEVACHKCWQCVRRKIDDWTGRCIAESRTAAITRSVTLTYGRDDRIGSADHLKAAVLTYSDVQRYFRSLRDAGYEVRYFVCGEYGSRKGRAHWHAVLFFYGAKLPLRPLDRNFDDEHWPHGHSFWQQCGPETIRYVTKYIAKEAETEERQFHMSLSKNPPLGDAWFRQRAGQYVAQKLAPQDLFYTFEGDRKPYMLQGKSADNFLRSYVEQWAAMWADHMPNSELVESFVDAEASRGSEAEAKRVIAAEKLGLSGLQDIVIDSRFTGSVKKPSLHEFRSWMHPERLRFNEQLNVWQYEFDGDQSPWYWAKDAGGCYGWRAKIGAEFPKPAVLYGLSGRRAG